MLAIYKRSKEFAWRLDWRQKVSIFILLTQAVIPLKYYILNGDVLDERFCWRMLSGVSMAYNRVKIRLIDWDTTVREMGLDKLKRKVDNQAILFGHDVILQKLCDAMMDYDPRVRGAEVHSLHRFLDGNEIRKKFVCMK